MLKNISFDHDTLPTLWTLLWNVVFLNLLDPLLKQFFSKDGPGITISIYPVIIKIEVLLFDSLS